MSNNKTGLRHAMLNSDTLAGEFCEILTLDAIFGDLVQCEGGLPMPFEANVPDPSTGEMLGVAEGIGVLTEGASTSIEVKDYQGVYKEVLANNPAWEGARWDGDAAYAEPGYPLPRLIYAPEKTNQLIWSRNLDNWTKSGGLTSAPAVGIDGSLSASAITDPGTGVGAVYTDTIITPAVTDYGVGLFVEVINNTAYLRVDLDINGVYRDLRLRYSDGNVVISGMTADDYKVSLENGFYRIFFKHTDPDGTDALLRIRIYPFFNETGAGAGDSNLAGTVIVDGVEIIAGTTLDPDNEIENPPVFTAGAPVTRTARALSFDGANHDPDQSGYYFEWEPSMLPTGESGNWGILTFDGASTNTFYHHGGATPLRIRQWYGANTSRNLDDGLGGGVVHPSAFVIDTDEADSLSAWDNDAGDWTAPLASSGSPAVSTINLGQGSPYVMKFGPIRRYQAPLDEMKAQLEADIAAGEAE